MAKTIYIAQMCPLGKRAKLINNLKHFNVNDLRSYVKNAHKIWVILGMSSIRQAKYAIAYGQSVKYRGKVINMSPVPKWVNGKVFHKNKEEK